MEIKIKANNAIRMLQITSARLKEGKALFDPIKLVIVKHKKEYRVISMMMNRGGTAYVIARFGDIQITGVDEDSKNLCVSADTLISYFEECYGSDETLFFSESDDGVKLKIINEDAEFPTEVFHPRIAEDDGNLRALEEFPFKMKNGIPYYQEGTVKPDTEITIESSEIHKAIKHKSKVVKHAMGGRSPKYYDFKFHKNGSFVIIGDREDLTMTPIKKHLKCTVEGSGSRFLVGDEDVEHIMGVLSGQINIYSKTDYPIWITQKSDDYAVGYLIAPKAEDETVEVEVTEDGDVEVVDVDTDEDIEIEVEDVDDNKSIVDEIINNEVVVTHVTDDEPKEEPEEEPLEEPKKELPEDPVEESKDDEPKEEVKPETEDDDVPDINIEKKEETSEEDDLTDLDLDIS